MSRELLVEKGTTVFLQDENGNQKFFNTLAEFQMYSNLDLSGKNYIDYAPDDGRYIDDTDQGVAIPNSDYDTVIATLKEPYYGMSENEKKDTVLAQLLDAVDGKTNQLIETGWVYPDANGQEIRLNGVDQANYEGEKNLYAELDYDGVDVTSYFPLDVKVWTGPSGEPIMVSMVDLAAYKTFIRAGKGHIRTKLQEGWLLKGALIAMDIEGLKSWEDPR